MLKSRKQYQDKEMEYAGTEEVTYHKGGYMKIVRGRGSKL